MFPEKRMRRVRGKESTRHLFEENQVASSDLIQPLFVEHRDEPVNIESMPEVQRLDVESAVEKAVEVEELGIPAVILFGVPSYKDGQGSSAWDPSEAVQEAIRRISEETGLTVIADTCLCEYTDHGHCGPVNENGSVANDRTLNILGRVAVSQAEAGADIVAPSGMMDGMVQAIREALDSDGYKHVAVVSYSAKYCSGFYGPFREAAESELLGHRGTYQMQPGQRREAAVENRLDVEEGADALMVKPAMPYLDIVRDTRNRHDLPVLAYQVSGEYSMLYSAVENGLLPEEAKKESLVAIKRAGADAVITYFAEEIAKQTGSG